MASVSIEADEQHRSLLIKLCDGMNPDSQTYHNFIFILKSYLPKGRLDSVQQKLTNVFDLLEEKGVLKVGKYDILKTALENSGYAEFSDLVKREEKAIIRKMRKRIYSDDSKDVGSANIETASVLSVEPEGGIFTRTFPLEDIRKAWQSIETELLAELDPTMKILSFFSFLCENECQAIRTKKNREKMVERFLIRVEENLPNAFLVLLDALEKTDNGNIVRKLSEIIQETKDSKANAHVTKMHSFKLKIRVETEDGSKCENCEVKLQDSFKEGSLAFDFDLCSVVLNVKRSSVIVHLKPISKYAEETLTFFCQHGGMKDYVLSLLRKKDLFASLPTGEAFIEVEVSWHKEEMSEGAHKLQEDLSSERLEVVDTLQVMKNNLLLQYGSLLDEIEPLHLQETFISRGILGKSFFEELTNLKRRARAAQFLNDIYLSNDALVVLVEALKVNGRENLAKKLCSVERQTSYLGATDQVDDTLVQAVREVSQMHADEAVIWSSRFDVIIRESTDESHKASEVLVSDERKQLVIEETAIQIGHENFGKGQSNVKTEMPQSESSPEDSEGGKQVDHKVSEVPLSDEKKQPVFEETPSIPIQQRLKETLDQARINMSTEEVDLFLKFQREIGTTLYFSADPESLNDAQKSLDTTESFLKEHYPDVVDTWLEYRDQGKLTHELIDVIYVEERNKNLHEKKSYFLNIMEQLHIISRARSFNENGVKEENYFFTPCVLRKKSPSELIAPEKDARMVSTSVLCWVITGTFMLPGIFQKLIAACLARWPVAKKKGKSENLIFQDCTVFDLDLIHRLFLHCENHAVYARISRMGIDKVNAKICTRARKFITMNLSEIISHHDPNLEYMLCIQNAESQDIPEDIRSHLSPPCEMWFMDEVHNPDAPITREHTNHARLCVALVTVCRNAMRTILHANIPAPYKNIYQAILANKTKLVSRIQIGSGKWQNALLNKNQCKMLFPDPMFRYAASIDQCDISLLYALIRNVSSVNPPSLGWGVVPQDRPRDKSLGANVERIHLYRNEICGHSVDGQISQDDFEDYWNKIDSVLHDIDAVISGQAFSQELEMQRGHVISVYEAC